MRYPSDVTDAEWDLAAPYLTLMTEDAPQRESGLREVPNALRWPVKTGGQWRMMPHDFPPRPAVDPQARRWVAAGRFVPMCLLCAIVGVRFVKGDINIFTQVGFIVLVGLACKNAILIVEFAQDLRRQGKPLKEATLDACQIRLRPIVMTSFAFILGVFPLLIAQGAGSEMRKALGVAVFSGMIGVTLFGVLLTPVFYYVIERLKGGMLAKPNEPMTTALAVPVAENTSHRHK